jgi:hypothetical protein
MIRRLKEMLSFLSKQELFWLMLFGFTIRNNFYQQHLAMFYNTDSVTYYYAAQNIFHGLIDGSRPPVYPILIKISEWIWPGSPFKGLIIFQHFFSFSGLFPFYLVSKKIMVNRFVRILANIVWIFFPPVLAYNNGLFAESILISSMVWFIWLFSEFFKRLTSLKAILLNLVLFILVMIKPVALAFYGALGAIWIFTILLKKHRNLFKPIFISYLFSIGLIAGYSALNKYQNDYYGITTVSHDNTFINVILSDAYRTLPDNNFITTIDTTLYKGHYYTVYFLNNDHDKYHRAFEIFPLEYMDKWDMKGVYETPPNQLGYNSKNIAPYLKKAQQHRIYKAYMFKKPIDFLNYKFLYINGMWLYFMLLVEIVSILYFIVKRHQFLQLRLLIFLMVGGLLMAFFMKGVFDGTYQRVLFPLAPFLILIFFTICDTVGRGLKFTNLKRLIHSSDIYKKGKLM